MVKLNRGAFLESLDDVKERAIEPSDTLFADEVENPFPHELVRCVPEHPT
jgi:hypothetical protein